MLICAVSQLGPPSMKNVHHSLADATSFRIKKVASTPHLEAIKPAPRV
jgi:hypothetical protein